MHSTILLRPFCWRGLTGGSQRFVFCERRAAFNEGRYQEAIDDLEILIHYTKDDALAYSYLGRAYLKLYTPEKNETNAYLNRAVDYIHMALGLFGRLEGGVFQGTLSSLYCPF